MWIKRTLILPGLAVADLLMLTACAFGAPTAEDQTMRPNPQDGLAGQGPAGGDSVMTSPPERESDRTAVQTRPSRLGTTEGSRLSQKGSGERAIYKNEAYKFSVSYPAGFAVRMLSAPELAKLTPAPSASFTFMNPVSAASDIADIELPDLEIRVYDSGTVDSLEIWLRSMGLLAADSTIQPFETPRVRGLRVCGATMIFPNCTEFARGDRVVYQFRIGNLDGEQIVNTFAVLP